MKHLQEQIDRLPQIPGVYLYYNNKDVVIYVGKAKKIKTRVSSYFNKQQSAKTKILVKNIFKIEYFVVESEEEALLLENNLIKKYQPRYNILLKDDKTYPWICIKNEPFPQIFKTRKIVKDGSLYFGPYSSVYFLEVLLDLIKKLYPIRTCKFVLSEENIRKRKFKPCLEFHLGNCNAPCIGEELETDYNEYILHVKSILKGNIKEVKYYLSNQMNRCADELRFEEAEIFKNRWSLLNTYQIKSTVVSASITDIDVFSLVDADEYAFVNYLKIIDGAIIQAQTLEFKKKMNEEPKELLHFAIAEIRQRYQSTSKKIIVPIDLQIEMKGIQFIIPKRGPALKLLELSEKNAKLFKIEQLKHYSDLNKEQRDVRVLSTMKNDLRLKELPRHIECFDNSNIQGTTPVAACVVFINAKPAKKEYRHFNVKTVEGANDFASMEEIIFRRYKRLLEEQLSLPQLIIIDGGKGQLGAALNALEQLNLRGKIAIIGIAKRLEELYFPGDSVPLYLDKTSETLKVIQQLRDEAHRFGITFHRGKRDKKMFHSELDDIVGVGSKSKQILLEKFTSVEQIKNQSLDELIRCVGVSKGTLIYNYFYK